MEKFKELSIEEMQEVEGGDLGPIDKLFDHWTIKALGVMHDAADFISGLGDGFIKGFKSTNNQW